MKPIFLIGYMGSGKTTLGRALAASTGLDFIDLDEFIETRRGLSVKEIFAAEGEEGFRCAERDALRQLAARPDTIIACGGGTPCFHDNMALMNLSGTTVFLNASMIALRRRLSAMRAHRPLIADLDDHQLARFITDSLAARLPHYRKAQFIFGTSRLENDRQIQSTVNRFVSRFFNNPRR